MTITYVTHDWDEYIYIASASSLDEYQWWMNKKSFFEDLLEDVNEKLTKMAFKLSYLHGVYLINLQESGLDWGEAWEAV